MSHSNPPGNGCSLEDCYTNLFALTDICGIKWKTLSSDRITVDSLEDPVLQTYSKCINSDILCVWRRFSQNLDQPHATDQLNCSKELWIFWYGAEPENLKQILLKSELKEHDNGAWDKEGSGISYECRTLLFKALHNLIERCLLTKGFVRLGRWFVQPHETTPSQPADRGTHLSFCFNFFLHGESSVCASIEVKQHPSVWRLTHQHLIAAQENPASFPVILVPYGLSGSLTGNTYRESDQSAYKVLEEWNQFYPIDPHEKEGEGPKVPPLVEVLVAGVRMKYPSCYVLLCDQDETPPRNQPTIMPAAAPRQPLHNGPLTPPTSPLDGATLSEVAVKAALHHTGSHQPELNTKLVGKTSEVFSARITEKVTHDNCTTAGIAKRSMEMTSEEAAVGVWNFSDPTVKTTCNCSRHKARNKPGLTNQEKAKNPSTNKAQKGDKPEKVERQPSRLGRGATPFHRRHAPAEELMHYESPLLMGSIGSVNANFGNIGTGSGLPQLNSTEGGGTAGETPSPADMSPLDEQQSQNQILDPSMPKLSPHPPVDTNSEREVNGANTCNNKSSEHHPQSTVVTSGSNEFMKPVDSSTPKVIDSVLSPTEVWGQQSEAKTASINSWIKSQQTQRDTRGIKRPSLPTQDPDEDELVITTLYDFNSVKSWCDYPVKKLRLDHRHSIDLTSDESSSLSNNNLSIKGAAMYKLSSAHDPYAFPDDGADDAINPGVLRPRPFRPSHDERQSPHGKMDDGFKDPLKSNGDLREDKSTDLNSLTSPPRSPSNLFATSLTREQDLMAKVSDLDHMFESDDDNDDAFVDPSAPTEKMPDEGKMTKLSSTMTISDHGTIGTSELIRMYPTPPSNNPSDRSPGTSSLDVPVETTHLERPVIKTEIFTSSAEDLFKDLSPVYKLPERADFKGSDKYSPISLQSRLSPTATPPEYRGTWQLQFPIGPIPDIIEKPQSTSHYVNIPSIENIPSLSSRLPSSAIESSPATFQNSVGQQRTPTSFELQSPPSNASSYLNKTLNSVDNQGTNNQIPEVHSLIVNIYLMDSRLNLFRDHNFDSCNICVCNMNIKGNDVGVYVPDTNSGNSDSQTRCVCGFSAILNRRNANNSGLFYEDEVEITGIRDDRYDVRKPKLYAIDYPKDGEEHVECDDITQSVLELLLGQYTLPYPSSSISQHLIRLGMMNSTRYAESPNIFNMLQIQDGNEAVYIALDQGRQAMEHCSPNKLDDPTMKSTCLHKWQFLQGAKRIPQNSQDSVQVLKSLQPLLQDAIQNKRVTRLWDKLSGPLTWKEFHQLAGRGNQENSTPQPVPSLLVGHDRDWLSVSPYALKFWDKQFLEPYSKPRDIAYVVLAPDNEHIINAVIVFFKELSTMYELSHMGRHSPVSKKLRDGIMRVGKKLAESIKVDEQLDPWFKQIGNSSVASKLRLYAQVCRTFLAPHLAQLKVDQSVFEPMTNHRPGYKPSEIKPDGNQSDNSSFSMPAPSSTPASQHEDRDAVNDELGNSQKDGSFHETDQEDSQNTPALMVYLIDPFTYSSDWNPELERLTKIGLLRCYQQLVKELPEHMQNNVSLQILPLSTILESTEKGSNLDLLKSISFSIFTTCRWNLTHTVMGKHLTGFGPAAAAEIFLRKKEEKGILTKLYNPPFVLAPVKDKQMILKESTTREEKQERSVVLFCAYCLSEDQRWLLAVCTDENGELMETCTINVEIPNRNRRKKASARKIGLHKLWDFLLGMVSMTTMPSRIVIGRLGRIGHGEMKGWSGLLSKRNLAAAGKRIKEICTQCSLAGTGDFPTIVSACLVSMESHTSFNVMADTIKVEERMSSNCPLQTPRDTSTTHILVFPTSATAQANSSVQVPEKPENDFDGFGLDGFPMDDNDDPNEMINTIHDAFLESDMGFLEVFQEMTSSPHNGGPIGNLSNPSSPTGESGRHHSSALNGPSVGKNTQSKDPQDEPPNLNQQPLAMGYYLSTANPGPLPKWFWSTAPENEYQCPTCLKAALHIHCSSNHDDFYQLKKQSASHPLDSTLTPDVLRYVLENYNALSWLTFDTVQNNRQSCLPIHFMVLLHMYHALNAFV